MQQARDDKLIVFNPPILTRDGKYRECDLLLLIHGIYDIIQAWLQFHFDRRIPVLQNDLMTLW